MNSMLDFTLLYLLYGAAVGVLSCLISESNIAAPIRRRLGWQLLYCPICLGFWVALPAVTRGLIPYFATVAFSNVWMLVILKVYRELDESTERED
jgi:hypothetical protein